MKLSKLFLNIFLVLSVLLPVFVIVSLFSSSLKPYAVGAFSLWIFSGIGWQLETLWEERFKSHEEKKHDEYKDFLPKVKGNYKAVTRSEFEWLESKVNKLWGEREKQMKNQKMKDFTNLLKEDKWIMKKIKRDE